MSIISMDFLWFTLLAAVIYYLVPKRTQGMVLLAASLWFYGQGGPAALGVAAAQVGVTYGCALRMTGEKRRPALWTGIALNLLALCGLKWANLSGPSQWILPLGISFYTLTALAYLIDVSRGDYPPEHNPLKLALFVLFFPQVSQGPIARYPAMRAQLFTPREFHPDMTGEGFQLALWGALKKLVIADNLALIVNAFYGPQGTRGGEGMIFATVLYSIQLYADFSGCMDIVGGAARLFGIELAENFRRPYFAATMQELWRRWHITLGEWFRDYVFFPLSGSRLVRRIGRFGRAHLPRSAARVQLAALPTMTVWTLTGLWHGLAPKFAVWGALQGLLILGGMVIEPACAKLRARLRVGDGVGWYRIIQILRTFAIGCAARVLFRADSLQDAWAILRNCACALAMPHPGAWRDAALKATGLLGRNSAVCALAVALACGLLLYVSVREERGAKMPWMPHRTPLRWAVGYALLMGVVLFGQFHVAEVPFLYMQF